MTGESLGQVASQTLDNLAATNAAVEMQIFRPLIGSDKLEIIADAQKLGTFEISSNPAPDCCTLFMPRSPETHAKIADVEAAEEALPWQEWIEDDGESRAARIPLPFVIPRSRCGPCRRAGAI